ncbi:LapA family protein [Thiovibrio frasassiensis]|uniref:LapA family protein n=1 Tax=Thiovibrio frasassiensis TaxID=2984131 RepID=A0A9X4RL81_9BACT|nr:LapA family protein [Thiovibrio frasassiensis]MDG4475806.1 LapA family protein [Thiovibrio frasassiensis]
MKVRTLFLLIILGVITVFAALNWNAFMAPTTLSLGVANVQAPLGIIMLGLLAFLSAVFLIFIVSLQTSVLFEARRHARELQANRELADQAEASRFTELRGFLEGELKRQAGFEAESKGAVLARLDQLEQDLRASVEQSGNMLSAYIGELEDRLEKVVQGTTLQSPS